VNVFPAAIKDVVVQLAPDTTGYLKIDLDFDGHSTYEPLKMRVEQGANSTMDSATLKQRVEDEIRSKLTVRVIVTIVPEGAIERPGAQKEKLLERIKIS